ncbi:hypothetical protein IFO70_05205 [Phormidium tenue FACHB-886]|nr:hypothetical protein [Phormidium tenue FACHB-886]
MSISSLRRFLTAPIAKVPRSTVIFWFVLSLAFAVIFGCLGLQQAFRAEYVVQDDARQHVFWMQRYLDPELFPNDWIADYFQSIAPAGFAALYRIPAAVGINPLLFNKFLPMVLGLVTTVYAFGISVQLLPIPLVGFAGSLILNQNLWVQDDLVSGTARSFLYPCFLAFLYYLLRSGGARPLWQTLVPCLVAIGLQGLFYPQFVLIMAGILVLRLVEWQQGRLRLVSDRRRLAVSIGGLAVAVAMLLPYALEESVYGGAISGAVAQTMPEFAMKARSAFFTDNFWTYWVFGRRSGLFFWMMPLSVLALGLFPLMVALRFSAIDAARLSLMQQVRHLSLFAQAGITSLFLFFAAHALLFRLYLPGRYTQFTIQIFTSFAAAIVIVVLIDAVLGWAEQPRAAEALRRRLAIAFVVFCGIVLLLSPKLYMFPKLSYVRGTAPDLYEFFAQQPKDILVASLAKEVDNIPSFSQRSILVGREYALPYQLGYYQPLRQRITDLIRAQYSLKSSEVREFVRQYGIDYWMIDRRYLSTLEVDEYHQIPVNDWLRQFKPEITEAADRIRQGENFAIAKFFRRCKAAEEDELIVLDGKCILDEQ